MPFEASCDPTEKIIHEEPHDDHWGTWNDRIFINGSGPKKGIGMSDGCVVRVYPIKSWLELSDLIMSTEEKIQKLEEENNNLIDALIWCSGSRDFAEGGVARQGWLNICRPLIIKDEGGTTLGQHTDRAIAETSDGKHDREAD